MKLYYYGIDNIAGGLENYAKTLITSLLKLNNKLEVVIISCYSDYAYRDYFESLGAKSIIISNYKKHPFKYKRALTAALKDHKEEDIIQLNVMSYRNLALFSAAKKTKIKTFVVGHANNLPKGFINCLLHKLGNRLYRGFGKKIAISKDVIPYMFKGCKDVAVIPSGIDLERYSFDQNARNNIRKKYNIENSFVVGQVGRLSYAKNQPFSIKIIGELSKKIPNAKLMIIGKNQDDIIYDLVRNNPNVIYVGEVDDSSKYYSVFDIQLMPSIFEGFGLAVFEGLANGLNIYISDNVPTPTKIKSKVVQLPLYIDKWVKAILEHQGERDCVPAIGVEEYDSINMAKEYYRWYLI